MDFVAPGVKIDGFGGSRQPNAWIVGLWALESMDLEAPGMKIDGFSGSRHGNRWNRRGMLWNFVFCFLSLSPLGVDFGSLGIILGAWRGPLGLLRSLGSLGGLQGPSGTSRGRPWGPLVGAFGLLFWGGRGDRNT